MMWNFNEFLDNTALRSDDGTQLTYRELGEETGRLASAIGKRCLVFSMCSNTEGSVIG